MNPIEFIKTIYVGDRGCKSLLIDGFNSEVKLQVDCISRVRGESWNHYTTEDMEDGFIVFEGVTGITLNPSGLIPNDFIYNFNVDFIEDMKIYRSCLSIGSVTPSGEHSTINICIYSQSICLEKKNQ